MGGREGRDERRVGVREEGEGSRSAGFCGHSERAIGMHKHTRT